MWGQARRTEGSFSKDPVSDGFQGRVLLSVVFCFLFFVFFFLLVCLFFNASDLLLRKASFKILHNIF